MDHLLDVQELCIQLYRGKAQPPVQLTSHLSFAVDPGQTLGIVGESGCGKSITASAIMGLLDFPLSVARGKILLQEESGTLRDLLTLDEKAMQQLRGNRISMIFQEPMTALDPMYTVEQQIAETLEFHTSMGKKEMRRAVLDILKKVKIPRPQEILREYPHHLSGGMLQRIMIAIAMVNNPRLLIADEPTTALDVTIQAQILDLMNELQDDFNTSTIMITHDLGVIAETCRETMVLYAGQVMEQCATGDLFHQTAHPYTLGLLKSMNSLGGASKLLYTIAGSVPAAGNFLPGCRFADRCPYVMDICKKEEPPLAWIASGHQCRCHLHPAVSPSSKGGNS